MLNYIWGGLIIFSLVFALVADFSDIRNETYRNGVPLEVRIDFPDGYGADERRVTSEIRIDTALFRSHYAVEAAPGTSYGGTLIQTADGRQLRFDPDAALPEPLATIRDVAGGREDELQAVVQSLSVDSAATGATASLLFPVVRFVKMNAISAAALDFAQTAVTLAIGLIGALALWLGLLRIAEKSGILYALVRFTQPVLRRLFPEIPEGHPAMGMIALNLTANVLGLGNAATPLGLKAMEELQTLNPTEDTATNSMVMLLAMNTASVQLVPPVLLVAIMGLQINQIIFSIVIVTALSLVIAITTTKVFGRFKTYRLSDPARLGADDEEDSEAS
ncbi:MAG: nucleoside recognition domain-containing protein [Rhodothermales bacterium]|nr:nucleoside recognition domain-containing protein [Rhodothermales bacterium]